ncbi:MAG: hypothetical protein HY290_02660 [Planctomycetia bacterium]|nr:hypothetical protein [Planctomycetia bacterium]
MSATRREFLQAMAGSASFGLAQFASFRDLVAGGLDDPAPAEDIVRFGPDIEPIVRLIEVTPREKCVAMLVEQLRRGLPYRRFLAAAFYAGIRKLNSNHVVYMISSLHEATLDLRPELRLLPLFWAVDVFKKQQESFPSPPLPALRGALPSPERAASELADAMQRADIDGVERAFVALARSRGARQAVEELWPFGCQNGGAGGHGAIALASCARALEAIGGLDAETALRFAARHVFTLGGDGKSDAYFPLNKARVDKHAGTLPAGWAGGPADQAATRELFGLMREGKTEPACDLAVSQLLAGGTAQSIWDAVHLTTAELMVRHNDGWGLASRPLHSNTSINALHHAFRTLVFPQTRLLVLLQAVAWAADKTNSELRAGTLRDIEITRLPNAETPPTAQEAIREVFSLVPLRYYDWLPAKGAELRYGERSAADEACRKTFALCSRNPGAAPLFVQEAREWQCRKSTGDSHEYKFQSAILEEAGRVSAAWQPHLLAASVHYFHGAQSLDNPAVVQAQEALHS